VNSANIKPIDESLRATNAPGGNVRREVWPVPPVPFTRDNRVDERALDELVEFYVRAGVDGLFILAYSGEAFELTAAEQLAICRRVVARAAGRLRVVVAGNFGQDLNDQIERLKQLAQFGPDALIVFLSTLPNGTRMTDDLLKISEKIDAPLGVYECPVPEHRVLSPSDVSMLAGTKQFVFMKETSRDREIYRAKLLATRDSPLKLYQANWGQLPHSLEDGSPGFCGIIANLFPELVDAYCNSDSLTITGRKALHEVLSHTLSCIAERHYPSTMKYVLQKRGLSIDTTARMNGARNVDADDICRLDEMLGDLDLLRDPSDILSSAADRIRHAGERVLRGPHRPVVRSPRTSTAVDSADFD
jgi:4-hydroxy-tetrahydrodipicolinate synthase